MNSVHLIGRLTHDPQLQHTRGGTAVATFRIAVDRHARDGADFITVKTWGPVAQASADHLRRGRHVAVEGRLEHSQWNDADGSRQERLTVVAGRVDSSIALPPTAADRAPWKPHGRSLPSPPCRLRNDAGSDSYWSFTALQSPSPPKNPVFHRPRNSPIAHSGRSCSVLAAMAVVRGGWPTSRSAWWPAAIALALTLTSCATSTANSNSRETLTPQAAPSTPHRSTAVSPATSLHEQVTALWEDLHAQRLAQVHTDTPPDRNAFADLATNEATEAVLDLVQAARGDIPADLAGVEFWSTVHISADANKATMKDCILVATRPASQPNTQSTVHSQFWTGSAVSTDEGWLIDDIAVGVDNCVPPELNQQLLDAYREWHDATNIWWNPPNPEHPLLEDHMVDPGLADMRRLLAEHRSMGIVVRDQHSLDHAVVFELGIGSARISDCFPAHPHSAVAYDQETGERRDDLTPQPTPGQLDRTILDLKRTAEGEWQASGWRSTTNSDCTPGESPYAVAP